MRFRRRFAAAGFFGLAVAIACSPAKTSAPAPAVDAALRPFLLDPTLECATGSETGFESSLQVAYRELIRWLVADYGFDKWDAYMLLSQCGIARLGNFVDPKYSVGAAVRKAILV